MKPFWFYIAITDFTRGNPWNTFYYYSHSPSLRLLPAAARALLCTLPTPPPLPPRKTQNSSVLYLLWFMVDMASRDSIDTSVDTAGTLTSRALPVDANATLMATVLSEDLNLTTSSVEVECCDEQLGRKWTLTFEDGECTQKIHHVFFK